MCLEFTARLPFPGCVICRCEVPDRCVSLYDMELAPVSQVGHDKVDNVVKGCTIVERRREDGACIGEEAWCLCGLACRRVAYFCQDGVDFTCCAVQRTQHIFKVVGTAA